MHSLITSRRGLHTAGLFLISAFVLAAVACSSGDPSPPAASPTPTPEPPTAQEALDNARAAMAEVTRFEFELTHPEGMTSLGGGLDLRRAEGAIIAPERLSVSAEANLGRIFVKVSAIVIEDQTWMTSPLTGSWSSVAAGDSPFSFLDPVRLVTNVLAQTTDPAYPATGGISGNEIVFEGKVASEALKPLVGTVLPGEMLDVELTLERDTFLLTSARLKGRLQPDDLDSYVRLIRFSGFDADFVIAPPI